MNYCPGCDEPHLHIPHYQYLSNVQFVFQLLEVPMQTFSHGCPATVIPVLVRLLHTFGMLTSDARTYLDEEFDEFYNILIISVKALKVISSSLFLVTRDSIFNFQSSKHKLLSVAVQTERQSDIEGLIQLL